MSMRRVDPTALSALGPKQEALELALPGGAPAGIWACAACGLVYAHLQSAQDCCAPRVCECGSTFSKEGWPYTCCPPCKAAKEEQAAQARWDNARKLTAEQVQGSVYDDDNDEFHSDIGSFLDWLDDEQCERQTPDLRPRVYACKPLPFHIDASRIVEHALEDHHEDARDSIDDAAITQLQAMLDVWCSAQRVSSLEPDYERAVLYEPYGPDPVRPWRPGPAPSLAELAKRSESAGWWVCPRCEHIETSKIVRCGACGYEGTPPEDVEVPAAADDDALEGLQQQIARLRARPCPTMKFGLDPAAIAQHVNKEIAEVLAEPVGSPRAREEAAGVLAVAVHLVIAHGGDVRTELAGEVARLRARLDHVQAGGTWESAKELERQAAFRQSEEA